MPNTYLFDCFIKHSYVAVILIYYKSLQVQAMSMSFFGPLFRRKTPSASKGTKGPNWTKSLPLKQNGTKNKPADDTFGVTGNSGLTMELRKKIVTFRDVMDLPTCTASSPINQLVMGLMLDLQKLYPETVHRSQLSEMKGAPTEKILASFWNALKSIAESWMTNHNRLDKLRYDIPSCKENANWDQHVGTVLATLDCLIKMAKDKFDLMEEDEQKSNCSPRVGSFERFLGETDSESYTSSCPSPITPSSVLPEVLDSGSYKSQRRLNASCKSPLLLTLRVQAVGRLNPIDVKHLSLTLSNHGASDKSNILIDEPSRGRAENSTEKLSEEENRCSSTGEDRTEVPNPSLNENDSRNGIIDNRNCDDVGIATTAPKTLAVDTTELPPPTSSPNLTTKTPVPPPPTSLPTLESHVRAPQSSPPPPPPTLTPLNAATARQPPPLPPKAVGSTKAAPPAPPPLRLAPGSKAAGPPPPPPMHLANRAGPPPPPPMRRSANGAGPPPPPAPGGRSLLAKKSNTKLKRSSEMVSLYRILKGKVEGSSLNGKSSSVRKVATASSTAGGKGMADALAEMTKRSAYFQQIEEDVQKYSKAINVLKNSPQGSPEA